VRQDTSDRYRWIALSNTTLSVTMATIDGSIVIIAMPAIFRGIHLDPTAPGNISYLLWMIMGYLLVTAVLVVSLGRLGDMFGRVRIYNLGFVVFTLASIALSFDPLIGGAGALWLIGWRVGQAFGGAMLMANSAAILTDAFPARQRGMALGINQIAGISGQFIGLLLGGLLAAWDWRAVFWVNVPIGVFGTIWSYRSLREIASTRRAKIDWWGNVTFAGGAGLLLAAITYGIQPYGGHPTGWTSPRVLGGLALGVALLVAFGLIETKIAEPMFRMGLFKIRAFAAGNAASLLGSIARGGLQFMLIFWLQGVWLPLHGYSFVDTPLWAGIYMLPLTAGFLIAGPVSGHLSDRFGPRPFATAGLLVGACAFTGLLLLPVDFPYWAFALIIFGNGIGSGLFASPNTSAIMSSVPAAERGAASGMRATFQNSGMSLSIGVFFSLLIAGLAATLPRTLVGGLRAQGVPSALAARAAHLPPVSTLFASFLGYNPIATLLRPSGVLATLPRRNAAALTSKEYFPHLISGPFHHGLIIVFSTAIAMSVAGALISLLRGGQFYYDTPGPRVSPRAEAPVSPRPVPTVRNGSRPPVPLAGLPPAPAGRGGPRRLPVPDVTPET
jgi:MFS family permease